MKFMRILAASTTAMLLAVPVIGSSMMNGSMAVANDQEETAQFRRAAKEADAAAKALRRGAGQLAVTHAETAVTLDPRNGAYRSLLGEAYLYAGRFISASQALGEALTLDPANGRVALNLALSQIATGDWVQARATLAVHADNIPVSDRGLALALAGDPGNAVAVLMEAARRTGADGKTRQNLALSLALAGEWQQARAVASLDLSGQQLDQRMLEWANFARPDSAHAQVASLLGVTAVTDHGQPMQLALSRSVGTAVAVANPNGADGVAVASQTPVHGPVTGEVQAALATLTPDGDIGDVGMTDTSHASLIAATAPRQVVFAPRREIVQSIPSTPLQRPQAVRTEMASARYGAKPLMSLPTGQPNIVKAQIFTQMPNAKGGWFVQLGAYDSTGVARDAWGRHIRRTPALKGLTPSSASITTAAGAFHRLSVGGLSRNDAVALCRQVRRTGHDCFVRTGAGDQPAAWSRKA